MTGQASNKEQLEQAFQTFNSLSEQLISSYHQLESQVEQLNKDLDIARDQRLEQFDETRRLANRLERLLEALPGGVVVLDGKGLVQETNPVAADLLGVPLKGIPWRQVIQRAFSPQFDDGHEVSLKDGRKVSIATSTLGDEPGQILLIKDITDTRELQDKLSRYQRLSAMGQMAASLAHQIRTPTASALLYVSNLCRNEVDADSAQKYGEKVREQLRHIEVMIGDMLTYAKGGIEAESSIFGTTEIARQLNHAVQELAQVKGCALMVANNAPHCMLRGNKDALLGALINLVTNALNACDHDADVSVEFERATDGQLHILVRDNGCGIPEEISTKIFEPFVTSRPQGTGLGLAVVKTVVEKFDGDITFTTRRHHGTEFKIVLSVYTETQSTEKTDTEKKSENKVDEVWL